MRQEQGHILLITIMLVVICSLLGLTSLFLASQDAPGISAMKDEQVAEQLGEAASELVMSWFHDERLTPPNIAATLTKRLGDAGTGPMFFDAAGRSQFVGTAERPDVLLDAGNPSDNLALNQTPSGFPGTLRQLGQFARLKLYGPLRPGLLATVEATAVTAGRTSMARKVSFQLGALSLPALRAPLQVGQQLGLPQQGAESAVSTHWGVQRIGGGLVVQHMEDLVAKTQAAPVTGQSYDQMEQAQDRWTDYFLGGSLFVTLPPPGQGSGPPPPTNVHVQQQVSGLRLDQWPYDMIKRLAQRFGTYYRLDRQGKLHGASDSETDEGLLPSDVLRSFSVGDHRGLIFIDTLDGEPPRLENLGSLALEADYLEALVVVQGHVVLKPRAAGKSFTVLSPPPEGMTALGSRVPVQLTNIHMNGVLWSAGTITLERSARAFGSIVAGQTVVRAGNGATLEVWYDANLGRGLFRGLPVVYRVPGTWQTQ